MDNIAGAIFSNLGKDCKKALDVFTQHLNDLGILYYCDNIHTEKDLIVYVVNATDDYLIINNSGCHKITFIAQRNHFTSLAENNAFSYEIEIEFYHNRASGEYSFCVRFPEEISVMDLESFSHVAREKGFHYMYYGTIEF